MQPQLTRSPAYLTADEWKRFIAQTRWHPRDHALFTVMFWRGLRASEARLLTREDIDMDAGTIVVHRVKNSKTGHRFEQSTEEYVALTDWLADEKCGFRPFDLGRAQIWSLFRRYATIADIPAAKRHPHVLKHSIATHLLDRGLDSVDVQDWLGHKAIKNTMIYTHITNARRKAAAKKVFSSD